MFSSSPTSVRSDESLDQQLNWVLASHGFTGRIESTVESRLGRPINQKLADAGHLLYYDAILSITKDNACAACHSPTTGYADTQSIAVGIDSNGIVGPSRSGPRNRRRSPTSLNAAFYPRVMWNSPRKNPRSEHDVPTFANILSKKDRLLDRIAKLIPDPTKNYRQRRIWPTSSAREHPSPSKV